MNSLSAGLLLATLVVDAPAQVTGTIPPEDVSKTDTEASCSKYGEQNSGITRICFYDCRGTIAEISVPSATLCPF